MDVWVLAVSFSTISIFVVAVFFHKDNDYKPRPRYVKPANQYFNILAVVGSLCWLSFMVEHVLNMVSLVGVITGVSDVCLAVLIISVGNSFPGTWLLTQTCWW